MANTGTLPLVAGGCYSGAMSTAPDESTPLADIRLATAADEGAILSLMEAFNAFEGIAWTRQDLAQSYARLIAEPEWGAIFIAEVGGVPAGYAVFAYSFDFEFGGREGFLCELFVAERDRHHGLGKALMATVEAHARAHGVGALHLIVRQENGSAQILYRRDGFQFDPRMLMSKKLG